MNDSSSPGIARRGPHNATIRPVTGRSQLPLCFNQERHLLYEESTRTLRREPMAFNGIILRHVIGPLDCEALERAVDALVQRHSALRSAIWPAVPAGVRLAAVRAYQHTGASRSGLYMQSLSDRKTPRLRVHVLDPLPRSTSDPALIAFVRAEAHAPFDYATPPLIRVTLVQLDTDRHVLVITVPHVVADGWSGGLLVRDLLALYERERSGVPATLPPLAIRYCDYAAWERSRVSTPYFAAAELYWQAQWAAYGAAQLNSSIFAGAAGNGSGDQAAIARTAFDADTSKLVYAFVRARRMTLYHLLTAAAALVLGRVADKTRVTLWEYYSNRTQPGTEDVVGWFSYAHILGVDFSANPTVDELLASTREAAINGFKHHQCPSAWLFERWGHCPAGSDVFPGVDVLPRTRIHRLSDVTIESVHLGVPPPMSLKFTADSGGDQLPLALVYSRALCDAPFAERLLSEFSATVRSLIAHPSRAVSRLGN